MGRSAQIASGGLERGPDPPTERGEGGRASMGATVIDTGPDDPAIEVAPPAPVAEPEVPRRRWSVIDKLGPLVSVLCWFYLSVVAFLFAWVLVVWAAVGWAP